MKVFITRVLPTEILTLLDEARITYRQWEKDRLPTPAEFVQACQGMDGLINVGAYKMNAEILHEVSHLRVISLMSVGYDHVDIATARELGIRVGHTPDVLSNATADTAFLLLLATSRKALFHHKRILNGSWGMFQPMQGLGVDLYGKTLGIFGLGKIGYEMARRCRSYFGMKVIYHNRTPNVQAERDLEASYVSFEELLSGSDVLSVHSALTAETRGVFDATTFQKMRCQAIFINTARGGLHREKDLIEALSAGTIWGAGLDVFETEPTAPDNPLLNMENVTTFPHIGSATMGTRLAMATLAAQNLIAALQDREMPARVV